MKAVIKLANKKFVLTNENGFTTNDKGKGEPQSAENFVMFIDLLVKTVGAEIIEKDF